METPKLSFKEVKEYRDSFRKENGNKCPLCKEYIKPEEAALDHCHRTGHIRNTIHKDCNILLGKIENYIFRYGKRFRDYDGAIWDFMENVVSYMAQDYTDNPYHPTHRTPEDKQVSEWKKRMKRAKRKETKEKYKKLIQEYRK